MTGLIRRDLTSAFKLLRDRSDRGSEFYHLEQDEKEQLIEEDDDVVHFSANQGGFQIDSFKDNLEYHLGTIKSSLADFEKYNEKVLNRPAFDDDIDADENDEIDEMTDNLAKNFRGAQKQLNQIRTKLFRNKVEERMAKNLASRYATEMADLTTRFRKCQGKFTRRLKAREERQQGLVNIGDPDQMPPSPTHDDPFVDGLLDQQQQQAVDDAFLDRREKEMTNIAKSINELNQLFRDISSFVVEQGTILDQIEYNVENAASKTEQGLVSLRKTEQYQKKDRKMKAILCMAITVLILLAMLFVKSAIFG